MQSPKDLKSPSVFIGLKDKDLISFGSGQPDLPPPKEVTQKLKTRLDLRYGLIQGEEKLRRLLSREYPASDADNFIITNGASEALDLIFRGIGQGKVLIPRPYYYSYPPLVKLAGMEPVFTNLDKGRIDLDDFSKKLKGVKAIIINSPSNPTGRIESIETLRKIEKIAAQKGIYIISDEVYKDLIYERSNYLIEGERVITVNSFSKTYAMCGARIGYLWSRDQQFVNKLIDIKTHTSMNTSILTQDMAMLALKSSKSYVREQLKIWRSRRDLIYNGLLELGLDLWKPEGAFYVLPKAPNPRQFVWDMYNKHKVVVYLGAWFGAPDRVRLSYALDAAKIKEGLRRIKKYLRR